MRICNQKGCKKTVHNNTYMCKQHLKEYRAEYYRRTKNKLDTNYGNHYRPEVIASDLKGNKPIQGGLYQDCTYDQIQALESGDVERLRKLK